MNILTFKLSSHHHTQTHSVFGGRAREIFQISCVWGSRQQAAGCRLDRPGEPHTGWVTWGLSVSLLLGDFLNVTPANNTQRRAPAVLSWHFCFPISPRIRAENTRPGGGVEGGRLPKHKHGEEAGTMWDSEPVNVKQNQIWQMWAAVTQTQRCGSLIMTHELSDAKRWEISNDTCYGTECAPYRPGTEQLRPADAENSICFYLLLRLWFIFVFFVMLEQFRIDR